MLTATKIKGILQGIPSGVPMTSNEILDFVKSKYHLTKQDWAVHTKTRPTKYPKWCHRVQAVLEEYKRKGLVQHDGAMYIF